MWLLLLGSMLLLATGPAYAVAQDAVVTLSVNGAERGEAFVLLRSPDVLMKSSDLPFPVATSWVSLASLAPQVTYVFNEEALTLAVTAEPALLQTTTKDYNQSRPAGVVYSKDTSAFLNAAVTGIDFQKFTLTGEGGISIRNMLLFGNAFRDELGVYSRGLTNLTIDDREHLLRYQIGDRFDSTGPLGGSAYLGGISISREYLDPYFVRYPTVGLAGAVLSPTTADVYVNGHLVRREQLAPGPFELKNLPAQVGAGTAEVVLRDAFGREQTLTSPYYFSSGVLRAGLQEFSYNLGALRDQQVPGIGSYGELAFLARHRVGITDRLTIGGRMEAGHGLVSGGPQITALLPVGEVEIAAAGSESDGQPGYAASLAYTYQMPSFRIGGALRTASEHYATTSLAAYRDRAVLGATASVGFAITRHASLSLSYDHDIFRDARTQDRASVSASVRLSDRMSLFATVGQTMERGKRAETTAFAGLTVLLGDRTAATTTHEITRQGQRSVSEIQRSMPLGEGWGGRARVARAEDQGEASYSGGLDLRAQTRYGFFEADYSRSDQGNSTRLTAAAGIVAIGGGLHLTRPVDQSFALVDVGVPGVRALLNNQDAGRTDWRGTVLVPGLLPYYANRVGIVDQDLPLDYVIETTEKLATPPVRGGSIVTFPARRVQAFIGKLPEAAFGSITIEGIESPIGGDGAFYLENLKPGTYTATVDHATILCSLVVTIPASFASLVDLGALRCK